MREEKKLQGKERLKTASKSGCIRKLGLKEKKTQPVRFAPPHSEAARYGDHRGRWGVNPSGFHRMALVNRVRSTGEYWPE